MTSPLQQKLRIAGPVVVTGNRLSDGAVVYRTPSGGWSGRIADAEVLTAPEMARAALAVAEADGTRAVGPYLAPVSHASQPGNLREKIRNEGPTFALPGAV